MTLAYKMRAKTFDDFVGQKEIIEIIKIRCENETLGSSIFYGPPGVGKTTLANIIKNTLDINYKEINATTSTLTDLKKLVKETEKPFLLFVDEIHRFNKNVQDFLLPFTENGEIILIGATTENPYFEIIPALVSRSTIYEFKTLSDGDLINLLETMVYKYDMKMYEEDALIHALSLSNGDGRSFINLTEDASKFEKKEKITLETVEKLSGKKKTTYDKNGTYHYDVISAFIKSVRGSDENAAIFYLALMLNAGEDIEFIARRLVILASEDIGPGNFLAVSIAESCYSSIRKVGMPEARIILANTTIFLSRCKKDNKSYIAIDKAMKIAKGNINIPKHLRDGHYKSATKLGNSVGYKYPHDYKNHFMKQQYLPDEFKDFKI